MEQMQKKLWLFILTVLLVLTFGLPADAELVSSGSGGSGGGVLVTTDNSTVCVTTTYCLEFKTNHDLTVSDIVYLDFSSSPFFSSQIDSAKFTWSNLASPLTVTERETGFFEIEVPEAVDANEQVIINISYIKNPSSPDCYTFADVWTSKDPGSIQFAVNVTPPELRITPKGLTCKVGVPEKLTIVLVDSQGELFYVPDGEQVIVYLMETDVLGYLIEEFPGKFYDSDSEELDDCNCIYVKSGEASSDFYYQPMCEGAKKMYAAACGTFLSGPMHAMSQINVIAETVEWEIELGIGWNIISAPFDLQLAALNDVIFDAYSCIQIALTYDKGKWKQIYEGDDGKWYVDEDEGPSSDPEFQLEPLKAIYVKLVESSIACFQSSGLPSGPYIRDLDAGWNLVGPVVYNEDSADGFVKLDQVLRSIEGKYNQVTCPCPNFNPDDPDDANPEPWTYIPGSDEPIPDMEIGRGHWVYMPEPDVLYVAELA
jgi:hypothetical protein